MPFQCTECDFTTSFWINLYLWINSNRENRNLKPNQYLIEWPNKINAKSLMCIYITFCDIAQWREAPKYWCKSCSEKIYMDEYLSKRNSKTIKILIYDSVSARSHTKNIIIVNELAYVHLISDLIWSHTGERPLMK